MKIVNLNNNIISIGIVTNITIAPHILSKLPLIFAKSNNKIQITTISLEDMYSKNLNTTILNLDFIVVCVNFASLYPNIENDIIKNDTAENDIINNTYSLCENIYNIIKEKTTSYVIWCNFEDYYLKQCYFLGTVDPINYIVSKINIKLSSMINQEDTIIDLKRIIAQLGIKNAYNDKEHYRWNNPYSQLLISNLCGEIYKQFLIYTSNTRKCLVLDCDNVLWGGILSEDGIDNIILSSSGQGKVFQDFQRYLLNMYYHGVILTICSKNDKNDVLRVFREHSEMILKEEHIAIIQANWDPKPDNIVKISTMLNIGLNSMVFIDDSDFEIYAVREMLNDITAIKFNKNNIYQDLSCFNLNKTTNIDNVKQRINTYQTNEKRYHLKKQYKIYEEYIKALETKTDIHITLPIEINRISELTQRANKYTNGARYTIAQLKNKLNNNYTLYTVEVKDKFANLGIVGAIGFSGKTLDLFVLSCRALGRGVEDEMFKFCIKKQILYFSFISTNKNIELYKNLQKLNINHI